MKKIDKNNILKGASVLLIATVMILSTFSATANTMKERPEICATLTECSEANVHIKSSGSPNTNTRDLLWDNGDADGRNGLSCCYWSANPLTREVVDDFDVPDTWEVNEGYFTMVTYDGHSADFIDGVMVFFYEDIGNEPSTTRYAEETCTINAYNTGNIFFDRPEIALEVTFDTVELGAGKWWVCFQPQLNDNAFWLTSVGYDQNVWYYSEGEHPKWTDGFSIFGDYYDVNFKLYGEGQGQAIPDLDCDGVLNWEDIEPGTTVLGTFTVENIGEPLSLLDWEIESYPEWGNWTFTPDSGTGLTPEDGAITINVEVVAPDEGEEFTGEVKIVNSDDPDDFCIIDATMTDAVSQQSLILEFLEILAGRFPLIAQILAAIL